MKKKILFINGHLNTGGVEKSLVDILKHLDADKFEIELLLLEELGDYLEEIPKHIKVRLVDLHNTYGSVIQCLKKCIKIRDWKCLWIRIVFLLAKIWGKDKYKFIRKSIVGNENYDCVVGFRPGISSELAAYAVNSKKRITWWHHGEFNMNNQQEKDYSDVCDKMDQIVVVSNGCMKFLQKKFPSYKNKMLVIPNMLDINVIRKKADEYIPFIKNTNRIDFVSVGRLSPEKHFENIVYVAKNMVDKGMDSCRWFIVGEGCERTWLEKLIRENGLVNQVVLVGSKSNPYPYMKNADWIIHTSYVESQCLAVLEAMALKKACIVTESIGPSEFSVDKVNCLLAKANIESLKEKVEQAIYEKIDVGLLGQEAVKTIQKYSVEEVIGKIQELLVLEEL